MVPLLSSSPALASSPPTRSQAWPISKRQQLGKSKDSPALQPELRKSDASIHEQRRLSFSSARTPFTASLSASSKGSQPGLPPAVPVSKPHAVCVGFQAPADSNNSAALSPGRLQTKSSLLSAELLGRPSAMFGEIAGCASPSGAFQDLLVLGPACSQAPLASPGPLLDLQAQHPVFRSSTVAAAYAIAARAHASQTRKSGESVLSHCAATAAILAELGLPEEVVAAGLLHDVLCDTPMQPGELAALLPGSVVSLVAKVSQLNQLSQTYRDNTHSLEAEAMLDMLTGMDDVSALLIKLADRLHNMRTISALARCKQVRMASETLDVFAVLANRLGAWAIKAELEDLAFKTLNPEEYGMVAEAVAARAASTAAAAAAGSSSSSGSGLSGSIEEVTEALRAAGLEVVDVSGRVKNVYGVWKKVAKHLRGKARHAAAAAAGSSSDDCDDQDAAPALSLAGSPSAALSPAAAAAAPPSPGSADGCVRRAQLAAALSEVFDIQAVRVVVPAKHDCYAAMRVVQQLWPVVPGRVKDYIRNRKANGYQSLHLTVRDARGQPLEVQIRTPKMHYIAEYGFAAHWRYKEDLGRNDLWLDRLVQWKKWVASEKLGIVDKKMRPSGSPGGAGGGDAALADLAARLGLEAALSGGCCGPAAAAKQQQQQQQVVQEARQQSPVSSGDAVAAEFDAIVAARRRSGSSSVSSVRGGGGAVVAAAAVAAAAAPAGVAVASSPADEKFAARFRMQPISEAEVDQHGASVMVVGRRGAAIARLPARCTVGQLLGSREVAQQLLADGSSAAACRLAVNGVVVLPGQAEQLVLRSGDKVQLLQGPSQLPLLGLAGSDGPAGSEAALLGLAGSDGPAGSEAALPGLMADAGESLQLFVPGHGDAMEVALQQKLRVAPRTAVRSAALVS